MSDITVSCPYSVLLTETRDLRLWQGAAICQRTVERECRLLFLNNCQFPGKYQNVIARNFYGIIENVPVNESTAVLPV